MPHPSATLAGADLCSLGCAISRRDLCELPAHSSRLVELPAAGDYTRAKALPEESPFQRSRTLESNRLRQPATLNQLGLINTIFQMGASIV
jgi:hypothetical protein